MNTQPQHHDEIIRQVLADAYRDTRRRRGRRLLIAAAGMMVGAGLCSVISKDRAQRARQEALAERAAPVA